MTTGMQERREVTLTQPYLIMTEITPDHEERLTSLRHTPRRSRLPPSAGMEAKAFASTQQAYYSYR